MITDQTDSSGGAGMEVRGVVYIRGGGLSNEVTLVSSVITRESPIQRSGGGSVVLVGTRLKPTVLITD